MTESQPIIGKRIQLILTLDPHTQLQPGDEGTVVDIDDTGTIHIIWDSDSRLGLLPGVDRWQILGFEKENE